MPKGTSKKAPDALRPISTDPLPKPVNLDEADLGPLAGATEALLCSLQEYQLAAEDCRYKSDLGLNELWSRLRPAVTAVTAALTAIGIDFTDGRPIATMSMSMDRSRAVAVLIDWLTSQCALDMLALGITIVYGDASEELPRVTDYNSDQSLYCRDRMPDLTAEIGQLRLAVNRLKAQVGEHKAKDPPKPVNPKRSTQENEAGTKTTAKTLIAEEREVLQALHNLRATSADKLAKAREIHKAVGTDRAVETIKRLLKILMELKLVESVKRGSLGGYYLTKKGVKEAERK